MTQLLCQGTVAQRRSRPSGPKSRPNLPLKRRTRSHYGNGFDRGKIAGEIGRQRSPDSRRCRPAFDNEIDPVTTPVQLEKMSHAQLAIVEVERAHPLFG